MGGGGGGGGSVVLAGADALGAMVKLGVGAGAVTEAVVVELGVGSSTVLPGSEGSPHAANDEDTTIAGQIGRGVLLRAIVDIPDPSVDSSGGPSDAPQLIMGLSSGLIKRPKELNEARFSSTGASF